VNNSMKLILYLVLSYIECNDEDNISSKYT